MTTLAFMMVMLMLALYLAGTVSMSTPRRSDRSTMKRVSKAASKDRRRSRRVGGDAFKKDFYAKRASSVKPLPNPKKGSPRKQKYVQPIGYHRGDTESMTTMFNRCCTPEGLLTFPALLDSRYLRFWLGSKQEAAAVWASIVGSTEQSCSLQEMLRVHELLDQRSLEIEREMEEERVSWAIEELDYSNMEHYFNRASCPQTRLLSFRNFLDWEFVRSELWYHHLCEGGHDREGLTEQRVAQYWVELNGCLERDVDFGGFSNMYNRVRSFTLDL